MVGGRVSRGLPKPHGLPEGGAGPLGYPSSPGKAVIFLSGVKIVPLVFLGLLECKFHPRVKEERKLLNLRNPLLGLPVPFLEEDPLQEGKVEDARNSMPQGKAVQEGSIPGRTWG